MISVRGAQQGLKDGWAEWLRERPWGWYGTFTFSHDVSTEYAGHRWASWIRYVESAVAEPSGAKPGGRVRWARATERQGRGAIHFHALLHAQGLDHIPMEDAAKRWSALTHSYARIEVPDDIAACCTYLAKHVPARGVIDVGGPWKRPA